MIAATLSAALDRRAGEFLAAAQFSGSPATVRAARVIGTAATVARAHGIAGVEGYVTALEHFGAREVATASRMIRSAADEAITEVAFAAWSGRLAVEPDEPAAKAADAAPESGRSLNSPLAA